MAPTIWTSRQGPVLDVYGFEHPIGLQYSDLESRDLTDADLRFADLYGANLQRTNFTRANLSGSYLFGANLDFAIFNDTILNCVRKDRDPHKREDLFLDE
jgi:Pentapeptide repeats (8 copies)